MEAFQNRHNRLGQRRLDRAALTSAFHPFQAIAGVDADIKCESKNVCPTTVTDPSLVLDGATNSVFLFGSYVASVLDGRGRSHD